MKKNKTIIKFKNRTENRLGSIGNMTKPICYTASDELPSRFNLNRGYRRIQRAGRYIILKCLLFSQRHHGI